MVECKTIQFNPELFKVPGGNKTRKQRKTDGKEIKYKNATSSNNKTSNGKLLKYIREQQELKYQGLIDNEATINKNELNTSAVNNENNIFENSVNYLKSVSDNYQNKNNIVNTQTSRQQQLTSHNNKTIKQLSEHHNHQNVYLPRTTSGIPPSSHAIHSELPDIFNQTIEHPAENSNIKLSTKYNLPPPPKWGCLRNGKLQTYREYMKNQTQLVNIH